MSMKISIEMLMSNGIKMISKQKFYRHTHKILMSNRIKNIQIVTNIVIRFKIIRYITTLKKTVNIAKSIKVNDRSLLLMDHVANIGLSLINNKSLSLIYFAIFGILKKCRSNYHV